MLHHNGKRWGFLGFEPRRLLEAHLRIVLHIYRRCSSLEPEGNAEGPPRTLLPTRLCPSLRRFRFPPHHLRRFWLRRRARAVSPTPPTFQDLESDECVLRFEYVPHPLHSRFLILRFGDSPSPPLLHPFSPAPSSALSLPCVCMCKV